jgi:hypothetical protein
MYNFRRLHFSQGGAGAKTGLAVSLIELKHQK